MSYDLDKFTSFLPIFIIVSGIFLLVSYFIIKKLDEQAEDSESLSYRLKDRTTNRSELTLYDYLKRVFGDDFMVLSKVRVEDFIEAIPDGVSRREHWGLRNRIKSRHVDFLICDKNAVPLMAVELDGGSHRNYHRAERDRFLDDVFRQSDLPIEHIQVGSDFDYEVKRIYESLIPVESSS